MNRLALLLIWLLCLVCALIALVWMLLAILVNSPRAWLISLGFDRLGNATAGGDDGEYISSRCWRYRLEQPYRLLHALIDRAFALAGKIDHCLKSYQDELQRAKRIAASAERERSS